MMMIGIICQACLLPLLVLKKTLKMEFFCTKQKNSSQICSCFLLPLMYKNYLQNPEIFSLKYLKKVISYSKFLCYFRLQQVQIRTSNLSRRCDFFMLCSIIPNNKKNYYGQKACKKQGVIRIIHTCQRLAHQLDTRAELFIKFPEVFLQELKQT